VCVCVGGWVAGWVRVYFHIYVCTYIYNEPCVYVYIYIHT